MSDEITDVVQIVRVAYEGVEVAMKVGSGGVNAMLNAASFVFGMIDHEKLKGETSMKKLLMKGGDLQVVKLDNSQLKEAKKLLNKYGILYSKLPDINKNDNMSEILIHSEAAPRINLILERLGKGSVTSIEEYMENGEKSGFNKLVDFFDRQRRKRPKNEDERMANEKIDNLLEKAADFAMEKKYFDKEQLGNHFGISDTRVDEVIGDLSTIGALQIREDGTYEFIMEKDEFDKKIKHYQSIAEKIEKTAEAKSEEKMPEVVPTPNVIALMTQQEIEKINAEEEKRKKQKAKEGTITEKAGR